MPMLSFILMFFLLVACGGAPEPSGGTGGSSSSSSSSSGSGEGGGDAGPDAPPTCPEDACSDGNPCTKDALIDGSCTHTPEQEGTVCDDHGDMGCVGDTCTTWVSPPHCIYDSDCGPANSKGDPTQFCMGGLCWVSCEGSDAGSCPREKPGSTCSFLRAGSAAHSVCENVLEAKGMQACKTQTECPTNAHCLDGLCWVDCSGANYNRCIGEVAKNTVHCKRKVSECETFYVCQP